MHSTWRTACYAPPAGRGAPEYHPTVTAPDIETAGSEESEGKA